jgi:hypothetical protein
LFPRLKDEHKAKLLEELESKSDLKKPAMPQIKPDSEEYMTNFLKVSQDSKGTHSLQVFIQNLESHEQKSKIS